MSDTSFSSSIAAAGASPYSAIAAPDVPTGDFGTFLENLIDIVNPLQHLPVVSTLYRALTGDEIAGPARLLGGALFGGPLGAASAAVNLVVEDISGADIGEHILALLNDSGSARDSQRASLDESAPGAGRHAGYAFVANGDANSLTPGFAVRERPERRPGAAPSQQSDSVRDAPAEIALPVGGTGAIATATDDRAGTAVQQGTAASETSETVAPSVSSRPVWLAAAIAEAEQARAASSAGRDAPSGPPPSWIPAAMAHALDKYKEMATARGMDAPETRAAAR
jgi:hypothetical protein